MDQNFKKIIPFTKPYRSHVTWNVIFNILYALFSTLSFIALIPMMNVLFDTSEKVTKIPVYNSIFDITKFAKEYLYYYITLLSEQNGKEFALLLVIALVITTFLFKNLFNYLLVLIMKSLLVAITIIIIVTINFDFYLIFLLY